MRRVVSLAVAALLLVGCSAGSMSESGSDSAVGGGEGGAVEERAPAVGDGAADEGTDVEGPRQVITSGSISMAVDDPRSAADEVVMLVEHVGGFVEGREEFGGDDVEDTSARLVVRIPAAEVTGTLAQLEELGEVENVSLSSTDVTTAARDLEARIRALEISVERLEDLLSRSGSIEDIIEAERVLTERQERLEQLQSEQSALADQVAMSTIEISLWTPDAVPQDPPSGFLGGLVLGWESLVRTVSAALLTVGVLLPWALVAGLVLLVVLWARRATQRRRAATAPPVAPPSPGVPPGNAQPAPTATPPAPQAHAPATPPATATEDEPRS